MSSKTSGATKLGRLWAHCRMCVEASGADAPILLAHSISIVNGTTIDILIRSLALSGKYPRNALEARRVVTESQELEKMAAVKEFAGWHCSQSSRCGISFIAQLQIRPQCRTFETSRYVV